MNIQTNTIQREMDWQTEAFKNTSLARALENAIDDIPAGAGLTAIASAETIADVLAERTKYLKEAMDPAAATDQLELAVRVYGIAQGIWHILATIEEDRFTDAMFFVSVVSQTLCREAEQLSDALERI